MFYKRARTPCWAQSAGRPQSLKRTLESLAKERAGTILKAPRVGFEFKSSGDTEVLSIFPSQPLFCVQEMRLHGQFQGLLHMHGHRNFRDSGRHEDGWPSHQESKNSLGHRAYCLIHRPSTF